MKKIRLGVVGTGLIWEFTHMPIIDSLPDRYSVGALCVVDPDQRARWQAKYPSARIYETYDALVHDADIDVVLVATPIKLNPAVTIAALQAGKDVFEEKPIATTVAEAKAVLAAQKASGKTVYMLEQLLYDPKMDFIRARIQDGKLGIPVFFEMLTHFILDPDNDTTVGYSKTPWRRHPDFPLGAIFDGGAHDFAIIATLFGIPKTLYATGTTLREEMGEYDHILTAFSFENGMSGFHSHSAYLGGTNNYFNVRFSEGAIYSAGKDLVVEGRTGGRETIPFAEANPYRTMWETLDKVYNGDVPPVFTAEQAAQSVRIFDAIVDSIRAGHSVDL